MSTRSLASLLAGAAIVALLGATPMLATGLADRASTVGLGLTDRIPPTVGLGVKDNRPTIGLGVKDNRPTIGLGVKDNRPTIGLGVKDNRPTIGLGVKDNKPSAL